MGSYIGISFAIPIDEAMRVADQLRSSGRVVRGYLGIQPTDVPRELAEEYGLATGKGKTRGAFVRQVVPGAPGEKAGIQPGDVVLVGQWPGGGGRGRPAAHARRLQARHGSDACRSTGAARSSKSRRPWPRSRRRRLRPSEPSPPATEQRASSSREDVGADGHESQRRGAPEHARRGRREDHRGDGRCRSGRLCAPAT